MDNFFCTVPLLKELETLMIGCSGTPRQNRKHIPQEIKGSADMARFDMKVARCGNLIAFVWMDKKPIRFLTNCQGGFTQVRSWSRERGEELIWKPNAIVAYNRYKGGVDRSDQYAAYYSFSHRFSK